MNDEIKLQMELNKLEVSNSERIQLRNLKLEAFKIARDIRPTKDYNQVGLQTPSKYSAQDLIKDAEAIYESLIK